MARDHHHGRKRRGKSGRLRRHPDPAQQLELSRRRQRFDAPHGSDSQRGQPVPDRGPGRRTGHGAHPLRLARRIRPAARRSEEQRSVRRGTRCLRPPAPARRSRPHQRTHRPGWSWSLNAVLGRCRRRGHRARPVVGVVYYELTCGLQYQQTLSLVIEGVLLIAIVRFAPQGAWPSICCAARVPTARRRAPERGELVRPDAQRFPKHSRVTAQAHMAVLVHGAAVEAEPRSKSQVFELVEDPTVLKAVRDLNTSAGKSKDNAPATAAPPASPR